MKKYIYWVAGLAILAVVVKIITNRIRAKSTGGENPETAPGGGSLPSFQYDPSAVNREKTFGVGTMDSNEVAYLQTWLNSYFGKSLKVDGDFGSKTATAFLSVRPLAYIVTTSLNKLEI